jgi:cytoskeletal protein CcmA (bactofilin family)
MTCLTELTCAVYADGELSPGEARAAEQHLAGCARCRALVAAFRDESRVLAAALEEPAAIASLGAAPATSRATTNGRRVLGWGLGIGALAGLAVLAERLAGLSIGSAGPADWIGVAVDIALFVATNAAGLERGLTAVAILSMAGMALAGWLYLGRVPSRAVAMIALPLGVALGTGPSPSEALETRSGRIVTVGAGEKLGGTLVAAGETIRIEGTIDGDLIVAAARLVVRGTVRGDLVVAAGAVEVGGTVEGSAYVTAGALTVRGRVARGAYVAGREITIEPEGQVGGDLTLAARDLALRGDVERDVAALAHAAEVGGRVGRDIRFRGARLVVRETARVGGAVRADVAQSSDVSIEPGASMSGPVTTRTASRARAWRSEPRNWFWAATSFFGAVLLGWVGLAVVPSLLLDSADRVGSWRQSLGWGALVLLGAPVAIVLLTLTLVGIPIALVILGLYLLGVYAAKIVVAVALGRIMLRPRGDLRRDGLRALVVGLIVLTLVTALPVVGWPIWVVLACLGIGALAWRLARAAGVVRSSEA